MTEKQIKNKSASIRAKLHNVARKENLDLNALIILYMHERILYHISQSLFKAKLSFLPLDINLIVEQVKVFIEPIYNRLEKADDFVSIWNVSLNEWT